MYPDSGIDLLENVSVTVDGKRANAPREKIKEFLEETYYSIIMFLMQKNQE